MARNENIYFCFHVLYAICCMLFCWQRCAAGRLSSWLLARSTCQVRRSRCLLPGNPCQTHWWMRECGFCHEGACTSVCDVCTGVQVQVGKQVLLPFHGASQRVQPSTVMKAKKINSKTFSEQRVNIFQMYKHKVQFLFNFLLHNKHLFLGIIWSADSALVTSGKTFNDKSNWALIQIFPGIFVGSQGFTNKVSRAFLLNSLIDSPLPK